MHRRGATGSGTGRLLVCHRRHGMSRSCDWSKVGLVRNVHGRRIVVVLAATLAAMPLAARQADYPRPTGTQTENGLAGFAKILCSAVFVSGRDPAEAAKNSAYFFMPRDE